MKVYQYEYLMHCTVMPEEILMFKKVVAKNRRLRQILLGQRYQQVKRE
jgi:hypothetical protein